MVDGQITTLTKANKTSQSLRTTVPMGIIKQFGLKEGDKLKWRLEAMNNKLVIVIEPVKFVEAESR